MSGRRTSLTAYARAVERALTRLRGSPVVVSERDFALVKSWHDRGIPLAIVLDALRDAQRRGRVPRTLAFLAGAVADAWAAVAGARAGGETTQVAASHREVEPLWRARRDDCEPGSPLRELLDRAIDRAERGDDPAIIDAWIDEEIVSAAPSDVLAKCRTAGEQALANHRDRMPAETLARTLRRSVADRLREALRVPRLGPRP